MALAIQKRTGQSASQMQMAQTLGQTCLAQLYHHIVIEQTVNWCSGSLSAKERGLQVCQESISILECSKAKHRICWYQMK